MLAKRLNGAYERYWSAKTPTEERAAYYEILVLGGKDGWGPGGWRGRVARALRWMAARIEGDWWI